MSLRRDRLDEGALAELDALDAALRGEDNELRVFVADVRDAAPRPTPAFLAELDARVREGFPPRDDAPPVRAPRRRRRLLLGAGGIAVAGVLAVAVVGVVGQNGATTSSTSGGDAVLEAVPPATPEQQERAAAESAAGADTSAAAPKASAAPSTELPGRTQREVERSATLDLTVPEDEVQKTADEVVRATDRVGGIVQSSSINVGKATAGQAQFDLRVPSDRLDEALTAYSKLGSVADRTQDAQDITNVVVSAEDRLADARAARRALLRALGRADTEREVASIRARLRLTRQDIARQEAALRAARARADRATIAVTITGSDNGIAGPGGADDDGSWSLGDALRDAGRLLEVAAGALVVGAAAALPLLILGFGALLGARAMARRRRERGLDAA